jgi:hypothetical protein
VTYTAVQCPTGGGRVVCPVSQQTTSLATRTSTLVIVVPPGGSATFPATTGTAVSTVAFGGQARSIFSSSGSPVSYVPPPPPPTGTAGGGAGGAGGGVGGLFGLGPGGLTAEDKRIIIGVSVGVGVPLLIGIVAGCYL